MFFKKKKPWVRFTNAMAGAEIAHPVITAQSYNFDWYKAAAADYRKRQSERTETQNLNNHLVSTTRCPGLHQLFKTGFIITNPIDFTIETKKDSPGLFRWESAVNAEFGGKDYIGAHVPEQLYQFMPFREDTLSSLVKVNTQWKMYSSADIVFLQLPIAYPDHNMFTAAHGMLDPQIVFEINVQLFWHKLEGIHLVKAGTPLCHLVPIPRNLLVDMQVDKYTIDDHYNTMAYEYLARKEYNKDIKSFFAATKKLLTRK
jgi:hypothetical protein|tara:strand:+ start:944 stop:1717 length:774 start_codon:yes stop_codon:yes gene_type:complete